MEGGHFKVPSTEKGGWASKYKGQTQGANRSTSGVVYFWWSLFVALRARDLAGLSSASARLIVYPSVHYWIPTAVRPSIHHAPRALMWSSCCFYGARLTNQRLGFTWRVQPIILAIVSSPINLFSSFATFSWSCGNFSSIRQATDLVPDIATLRSATVATTAGPSALRSSSACLKLYVDRTTFAPSFVRFVSYQYDTTTLNLQTAVSHFD